MGAKKNYVGHNSKYVRHISKYLRHIFPPLKTARKLRRFVRTNTDSAFLLIGQHAKIYYGGLFACGQYGDNVSQVWRNPAGGLRGVKTCCGRLKKWVFSFCLAPAFC